MVANNTSKLTPYEHKLLDGWEEVFKKGQLTLWIMLALKDAPKYMAEIKSFMHQATNGVLNADDQSMYRALRRYYDAELVTFRQEPGDNGPDRKIYALTPVGRRVLQQFLNRNVIDVFYKNDNRSLIERNKDENK